MRNTSLVVVSQQFLPHRPPKWSFRWPNGIIARRPVLFSNDEQPAPHTTTLQLSTNAPAHLHVMEPPPPTPPRPPHLHLPVHDFLPVSEALCDVAYHFLHPFRPHTPNPDPPSSHPNPHHHSQSPASASSSISIAATLASQIRHSISEDPSSDLPNFPLLRVHDASSPPSSSLIAQEVATIAAIGTWADTFLSATARAAIFKSFSSSIAAFLHNTIPHPQVRVSSLFTLPSAAEARRSVFRMALQKRYGNLDDAPSTILSAGAPYVLYVSQTSTPHHPSSVENHALDNFDSIQSEMKGIAVIEYVGVPAEEITRAAIVSKLKDAVFKRALSPTLMIVDVQLHATLSAASGLLRAVCDSYGMHMHVEGNALSMSLTGTNAKNLFYNVSDLVDAAHTTSFDIANWFGNYNTAVVLHCPEPFDDDLLRVPNAPADLTACMSLSYLLQRMRLHTSADVLLKACEHAGTLVETADRLPSIFECRTVGCGEIVLLSCPASCLAWSSNKSINRALMAYFRRHHTEMEQFLELTTFDGREWLTFSPSHTLRHFSLSQLSSVSVLRICEDLINACRVHDLVSKGRAAFMSEIRQCHDVEVDLLESQHETADTKALFYAALRVTPFGEVARNGHWKGDEEMVAAVAKYTRSLADVLADQAGKNFEALFHPVKQFPEVIFIGPAVPQSRIDEKVTVEYGIDDLSHKNPTIDMILAGAEAKELEEAGAPDIATTVADCVISAVHIALSPHHRAPLDKAISHKVQNDTHDANGVESPDEAVLEASPIIPRLDQHDQSHPLTNKKQDEDSSPTIHVHASQTKPREEVNLVDKSEVGDLALDTDMNTAGESKLIPITSDPHVPESETTHQPKPRPGFWRTLFGNDSPEDTENDSSTESLQPLEDDYFRP